MFSSKAVNCCPVLPENLDPLSNWLSGFVKRPKTMNGAVSNRIPGAMVVPEEA